VLDFTVRLPYPQERTPGPTEWAPEPFLPFLKRDNVCAPGGTQIPDRPARCNAET